MTRATGSSIEASPTAGAKRSSGTKRSIPATRSTAAATRMSRRAVLSGCAACAGLLGAGAAKADRETDVLERIARARAPVRTLRGPFTQIRTIGLLSTDVRSHGMLWLVRPDRLRWQLDPPDDVTFWVAPEGLAYRSPHDQGRVAPTTARIASALADMRAVLGGDLTRLQDRWRLLVLRDDSTGVELQADALENTPGVPRSMRFALGPDLVRAKHVLLVEGPHDRTAIDFGELAINAPIDDSSMRPP